MNGIYGCSTKVFHVKRDNVIVKNDEHFLNIRKVFPLDGCSGMMARGSNIFVLY